MISKQAKDFIDSIKYVELEDTIPFVMMDMSKLPKGSDFDVDKTFDDIPIGVFIEECKKRFMEDWANKILDDNKHLLDTFIKEEFIKNVIYGR